MFHYDEFIGKARVYFERAEQCPENSEDRAIWLLLGLEFLLRAPLAKIHPTLLALPEGDSILHAAGVERVTGLIRSVAMKTVLLRLAKVAPNFGEDRGRDAVWLIDLRNQELHSSSAALTNTPASAWMPRFLNVLEALCSCLGIDMQTLVSADIIREAEAYRATADRAVQTKVNEGIDAARSFFEGLTAEELAARKLVPSPLPNAKCVTCPACNTHAAWVGLSVGRTTPPRFDEETQRIEYEVVSIANSLRCTVCNLELKSTGEVIAAGVDRVFTDEYSEDRYEGWEELMTYDDALQMLGAGEEYMNE